MAALQEQRHIYYDKDLQIEAYNLSGIVQKFPVHFHEFYVIGFMECGKRHLWCRNQEYDTQRGDVILFNPRETHNCAPIAGEVLDYRAINVPVDVMDKAVKEITGKNIHLQFKDTLIPQAELALSIRELYDVIVSQSSLLVREEAFYFLIEQLLEEQGAGRQSPPGSLCPPLKKSRGGRKVWSIRRPHRPAGRSVRPRALRRRR